MNCKAYGKGHEQREDGKFETIMKPAFTYTPPFIPTTQTKVLANSWFPCNSFYLIAIEALLEEILDTLPSAKEMDFYYLCMTRR